MEGVTGYRSYAVCGNSLVNCELVMDMNDSERISNFSITAVKLDMQQICVLLGDELFLKYIWELYPQYDIYEHIYLEEITLVHRYFLKRKVITKPKKEKFDQYITPMLTLTELMHVVKEH